MEKSTSTKSVLAARLDRPVPCQTPPSASQRFYRQLRPRRSTNAEGRVRGPPDQPAQAEAALEQQVLQEEDPRARRKGRPVRRLPSGPRDRLGESRHRVEAAELRDSKMR